MFDGLSLDLKELTGWSLAGVLFLLMALGRIVPLRTVRREQKHLEDVIEGKDREAKGWKAAHDTEAAQLGLILEELRKVVPHAGQVPGPPVVRAEQ